MCVWTWKRGCALEHVAKRLSLITKITFLQINIWRLQAVKLTLGCEIKGNAQWGCWEGRCTARVYTAIQLNALDRLLWQGWCSVTLWSRRWNMGSILARCLIYLFIRNCLCRLRPLINPGSQLKKLNQLTEDFVARGEKRSKKKKKATLHNYRWARLLPKFSNEPGVVIPPKVD